MQRMHRARWLLSNLLAPRWKNNFGEPREERWKKLTSFFFFLASCLLSSRGRQYETLAAKRTFSLSPSQSKVWTGLPDTMCLQFCHCHSTISSAWGAPAAWWVWGGRAYRVLLDRCCKWKPFWWICLIAHRCSLNKWHTTTSRLVAMAARFRKLVTIEIRMEDTPTENKKLCSGPMPVHS